MWDRLGVCEMRAGSTQDLLRPAKLADLLLELPDPLRLVRGRPGTLMIIDLGLAGPAAQRLAVDVELLADTSEAALGPLRVPQRVQAQENRSLLELLGVLPGCWHGHHPSVESDPPPHPARSSAGIGIPTPSKGTNRDHGNHYCYNRLQRALRAPAERPNAILKSYRALRHVTLSPHRIGDIVAATLVIPTMTRRRW